MPHELHVEKQGGWKSWFWMLLCCIPMVAVIVLVVLGIWSFG